MNRPDIVYVSYIRATALALWTALTDASITQKYWLGRRIESDWDAGSRISFWDDEGHGLDVTGTILEADRPRRLSYTWKVEYDSDARQEEHSRVTFTLEPKGDLVRLTIVHDQLQSNDEVFEGLRRGWPAIVSNLKTLLETGSPLNISPSECQA